MSDGTLRVNRSLTIPVAELEWRFTTSGGPGGQHANRAATKAEVSFDVQASEALEPRQRALLLERIGPVVTASAGESRSQARNREVALERLAERLAGALQSRSRRVATRPSKAAKRRRIEHKRRHGQRKRQRRRPPADD